MGSHEIIVIVGGGHAAAQLCAGLAEAGCGARVHVICDEPHVPYHRPPLSKSFLKNEAETVQSLRPAAWYAEAGITVHGADAAIAIDRPRKQVRLRSGATIAYGQLVLATGARARPLPGLPETLENLALLRSATDATRLRRLLGQAGKVTVLGGGFIGLEVAATAAALGKSVTVLEAAPRLLMRSVSTGLSAHVLETHRAAGIDVRLGVTASAFDVQQDRLVSLTVDGQAEPVDLLLGGIGAAPEHSLAMEAGLPCDNGILVDACLRTVDPAILAIGDCANFPEHGTGRRLRLESVQNANDQARTAVATLLGREDPYRALPWFWSEQGAMRLQMAGLLPPGATTHRRPGAAPASFSLLHYDGDRLACVESVNAPMDHLAARKLLEAGRSPAPATACDPATPLKSLI
ncbi:MAG: FAD-dependent oxidoreductase [Betaproteobacteria bacterium]